MPVRTVKANVVDLRSYRPTERDQFFVDTNSWYQLTYSRLLPAGIKPDYPIFLKKALEAKATLLACGITFIELANVIERHEWTIVQREKPHIDNVKLFRCDCSKERSLAAEQVSACWDQIRQFATITNLAIDGKAIERAAANFLCMPVDGYDLLMLEAMERRGVAWLITDDGDFAAVPDIHVFTANTQTINAAQRAGRLVRPH